MQESIYSWHILDSTRRNPSGILSAPSSSSASLMEGSNLNGTMSSGSSSLQWQHHTQQHQLSYKAIDFNPKVPQQSTKVNFFEREGVSGSRSSSPGGDEKEGGRAPVIFEAIQGIPSTKYTFGEILPFLVIIIDPERRSSLSLQEQCEIIHVLEDLARSIDFHAELTKINEQNLVTHGVVKDDLEKIGGHICKLYDPNEIFYTLLRDALVSR